MNHEIDAKIHSFLLQSLSAKRSQIIARQASAALRVEFVDERIEEREYDAQQRLRVDRVISRKIFRGEAHERYSTLVAGLREQGAGPIDLESQVRAHLQQDLDDVAAPDRIAHDPNDSLRRYSELMPAEHWPVVLCMAQDPDATGALRERLIQEGFSILVSDLLAQFGIFKLTCPPEMNFVRRIAGMPETYTIADALTPITIPQPVAVTTMMLESRQILGITPEIAANYGHDITLAVLDTGVDRSHPACARIKPEDYRDFTASGEEDVDGHGTHCASVAAGDDSSLGGKYTGIAPRCRLIAGKVLSPGRAGNLESILQGMAWAVVEKHADILSLSLGEMGTLANGQSIWSRACDEAFRKGTVVCVAAGNPMPSYPESVNVPADAATAIAVGAIDKAKQLAIFSAMGSSNPASPLHGKPNCVGPGVDVVAARSSAADFEPSQVVDSAHVRLSGTSMATPAIAGCLALLKSIARSLGLETTPAELVDLFYSSCHPVVDPDGQPYSSDMQIGHGLVNMNEALRETRLRALARPAARALAPPPDRDWAGQDFQPDTCYRCGKIYHTKVGIFSPVRQCRECGAPICQICWQLGYRECEKHHEQKRAGTAASGLPSAPAMASAARPGAPKGISTMTTSDPADPSSSQESSPHWGETFLNRFDMKIRAAGKLVEPHSGTEFQVNPKAQAQSFRRLFGSVTQFQFSAGLVRKERLSLAAVRLERVTPVTAGSWQPPENLLQQIAGPDGLDFQDEIFYGVGVFSVRGWPESWKQHVEARGNALFYLVEKGEGTLWHVFGSSGPLRGLFDPETVEEKNARAEKALAKHPQLLVPGDQISLDPFLEDNHLDRESVASAINAANGLFQIFEHKGKSYIQRSSR
jgi:hypothetical protein